MTRRTIQVFYFAFIGGDFSWVGERAVTHQDATDIDGVLELPCAEFQGNARVRVVVAFQPNLAASMSKFSLSFR